MKWQSKVVLAVALVLAVAAGWALKPGVVRTINMVETIDLPPTDFASLWLEGQREIGTLRGRIEGLQSRPPSVIQRTDTLFAPPEVCVAGIDVDAGGVATLPLLYLDSDSLAYRPERHVGIDISNCDDGFSVTDGEVICDPARLGHLYLGVRLDAVYPIGLERESSPFSAGAGAYWRPSYRSKWEIGAWLETDQRLRIGLRRGIQIF